MKALLRKKILLRRERQPQSALQIKNKKIFLSLFSLPIVQQASVFLSYVSFKKEVATHQIIRHLLFKKKWVAVPYITSRDELGYATIQDFDRDLEPGKFGILEPPIVLRKKSPLPPHLHLEVVLVPVVAFDQQNCRLGHGRGYFDRFLNQLSPRPLTIGLAYQFQYIERVPRHSHDYLLDCIVTEKKIYSNNLVPNLAQHA